MEGKETLQLGVECVGWGGVFSSPLADIKQNPLTLVKSLIKLLNSFQTKEERETIRQTFRAGF